MSLWRFFTIVTLAGTAITGYLYQKQLTRSRKALEALAVSVPQMKEYVAGRKSQLDALAALKASAAKVEGQTPALKSKLEALKSEASTVRAEFEALVASAKALAESAEPDADAGSLSSPELKLADGRVLRDARVRKIESDRLSFYHADGISSVAVKDLPADFRARLEMKTSTVFAEIAALQKQLSAASGGEQVFDGLVVNCPFSILESPAKLTTKPPLVSIKQHGAKFTNFEINVVAAKYAEGTAIDLTGAANGALQSMARLEGVSAPVATVKDAAVPGAIAKRATLKADRFGKKLLVESLYLSRGTQMWFVQLVLGDDITNSPPLAERILASVRLQAAQ